MSYFAVKHKVAIVTTGLKDISFSIAKELLKNGVKGVALVGAKLPLGDIQETYGPNKVIFIEADLTDIKQFEGAFQKTLEVFKNIDILVNTSGDWNNDGQMKTTINGLILAFEKYLPIKKSGNQAAIINIMSSGSQKDTFLSYNCSKSFIYGLTQSWGSKEFYDSTKVKVLGLYFEKFGIRHTIEECAKSTLQVLEHSKSGTLWIVEGSQAATEFILPERQLNDDQKWCR